MMMTCVMIVGRRWKMLKTLKDIEKENDVDEMVKKFRGMVERGEVNLSEADKHLDCLKDNDCVKVEDA